MGEQDASSHLALALDVPDLQAARQLIEQTHQYVGVYKVGLELFAAVGPAAVRTVREAGAKCFLDLKLHDIPATMGRSVDRASSSGADYLTIHAAAGAEALARAAESAGNTKLLAVTILTSLNATMLESIGFSEGPKASASRLAKLAWGAGIRGFVTSGHECASLRDELGTDAYLVTPGIRPTSSESGDQQRVMTPSSAVAAGANLLVIGRPIRDAANPTDAARAISQEIASALRND